MGCKKFTNITCPNRKKILEKVFLGRCLLLRNLLNVKTSSTLKIDVFKIPDNENIGTLFSKYKLLFLD